MTLTELMVVLVIIGIMSALATPMFRRDRIASEGREFASEIARELQRARYQAVSDRLPIRAFVFSDRVELRSAIAGATPADPPRPATLADPMLRVIAQERTSIHDVKTAMAAPGSPVLSSAVYKTIEFSTTGGAQIVGLATTPAIFIYVRNDAPNVAVTDRNFRIDIAPLTGSSILQEVW